MTQKTQGESRECEKWYGIKHNFDKWTIESEGDLLNTGNTPPNRVGFWMKQKRKCVQRGYTEMEYIEKL